MDDYHKSQGYQRGPAFHKPGCLVNLQVFDVLLPGNNDDIVFCPRQHNMADL